jgi:hypothetical protein
MSRITASLNILMLKMNNVGSIMISWEDMMAKRYVAVQRLMRYASELINHE